MESEVTRAIFDRLSGDATLCAGLATYQGEPAIFTGRTIPAEAKLPAVLVSGPVSSLPEDTLTGEGRLEERSLELWATVGTSAAAIATLAERIRVLLHREPMTITGGNVFRVRCSGPTTLPADGDYDGRLVTCLVRYNVD